MSNFVAYLVDAEKTTVERLFELQETNAITALINARTRFEAIGGVLSALHVLEVRRADLPAPSALDRRAFLDLPKAFGGVQRID